MARAALVPVALLWASAAFAAPCCGGGAAVPSLITGDDLAQLQASVSHGSVIGDAPEHGMPVFRRDGDNELTDVVRLDGAYRVLDRVQVGGGVPIVRRDRSVDGRTAQATGLGDLVASASYELLPEWTYSAWRPHGFVFFQTTYPTAPSTYDAIDPYQIDARGRGFFAVAAGAAFLKTFGNWDFLSSFEAHRSFRRTVSTAEGTDLTLVPGFGGSATLGAGYSPFGGATRVGLSLSPVWEQGIESLGAVSSRSAAQLVWNLSAQLGYLITDGWSASLAYNDQTWIGPARNVSLSRGVAVALQRRWAL